MTVHKDRMGEIAFWAAPPTGTARRDDLNKKLAFMNANPAIQKIVRKTIDTASALVQVQQVNGLGFPADQVLREYNLEYNSRIFNNSIHDLPGSFNVVEAFHEFLPPSATLKLRPEKDHLFSFNSFIDYVTSNDAEESSKLIGKLTENGVIYTYNSIDNPTDLEFSTSDDKKFGFSSVSLVRYGEEVSMILLAGQVCDLELESEKVRAKFAKVTSLNHRSHITPNEDLPLHAAPLVEGSNLWKTVVLVRFDLKRQTMDARYVYQDWGRSFNGVTDDRDSFIDAHGKFISPEIEQHFITTKESLNKYQALFELCKTCLLLPSFYQANEDHVEVERHPTDFHEFRKKLKNKKIIDLVEPAQQIAYRDAHALSKIGKHSPNTSIFFAPEYKIETTGFWKKIPLNAEGRDKNGRSIHGRTWVSQTTSWVEEVPGNILVEKKLHKAASAESGFIYVMRSAAHDKDLFKVGLTRRTADIRATELTRNTSSPDHFLVVEEWWVSDCVLAERLIHDDLAKYRINPNREFFKARYSIIFSSISKIISQIDEAI